MEVRYKSHKVTDTKGESVELYVLSSLICSPSIAHRLAICLGQLSGDKDLYLSVEHDDKVDRFIIYDNYKEEEEGDNVEEKDDDFPNFSPFDDPESTSEDSDDYDDEPDHCDCTKIEDLPSWDE